MLTKILCELQHGQSDHKLICVSHAFIIQLTKRIVVLCKYIIRLLSRTVFQILHSCDRASWQISF
jgi:hypothetical protein